MEPSQNIFALAGGLSRHAAARADVIAQNVANADTPGYRARDLPSFAETLARGGEMRATRPGHFERTATAAPVARPDTRFGAEAPNGNDVSLEDQMTRAVAAQQAHDLGIGVMRKALDILRLSLGAR